MKNITSKSYKRIKQLSFRRKTFGGRSYGQISVRYRGSHNKILYRFVDFYRNYSEHPSGRVIRVEYDPIRTAFLGLVCYTPGCLTYILLTETQKKDSLFFNHKPDTFSKFRLGSSFMISNINPGSVVHSVTTNPKLGGQIARAAGTFALLVKNVKNLSLFKLKSGEYRYITPTNSAVLGVVSGGHWFLRDFKKAGTIRRFGRRPKVRGYAKNPVDHKMGGRTKGGSQSASHSGKYTVNVSTASYGRCDTILVSKRGRKYQRRSI